MGPPLTVLAESPVRFKHRWLIPPIFNRLLDLVEPVKIYQQLLVAPLRI